MAAIAEKKTNRRKGNARLPGAITVHRYPKSPRYNQVPAEGDKYHDQLHRELGEASEHGNPFTASSIKGKKPLVAMVMYAKKHNGIVDPERVGPFFAAAGTFRELSSSTVCGLKAEQVLRSAEGQKHFRHLVGKLFVLIEKRREKHDA